VNWIGERLTESLSAGVQRAASLQASRSTQSPSLRMNPLSSASGMKVAGPIAPSRAWFQRSKASKPRIDPLSSSASGW
jgi:hypothetical protein